MNRLSFVIPTHNRASILRECLLALDREHESSGPFESIVVDDGSTDATETVVRALQRELKLQLVYIDQENRGPAAARNRGVEAAKGELIAFLGDDIVVDPGYVDQAMSVYDSHSDHPHGILGFTRYCPDCVPTPFGKWLDGRSDMQFAYSSAEPGKELDFPQTYTSNLLVPKQALLEVGCFNEGFRRAAYEDTELGFRLMQRGFKLYFCPNASAVHVHPVSVRSMAARMKLMAGALIELRSLNPELFEILYPQAERSFGHPSRFRRMVRWVRAEILVTAITWADQSFPYRLPAFVYAGAMRSTFSREVSRLWRPVVAGPIS